MSTHERLRGLVVTGLACLMAGLTASPALSDSVGAFDPQPAIQSGPAPVQSSSAMRPARSEESVLSALNGVAGNGVAGAGPLLLDSERSEIRIPFTIAPNAVPEGVELLLAASPESTRSGGRIEVRINRGRSVALAPRADRFEARFALYSDDLRSGENILSIRLYDGAPDGWLIDAEASRLRVSARPADGYAALDEIERALAADFAAPRRVHVDADAAGDDRLAVAALIAQGLALRMGEAPILVRQADVAEIVVRAELRDGAVAPAIDLTGPSELRLSAGAEGALIAAARLFAARSMESHAVRFDMTSALSARRLDRPVEAAGLDGAPEALAAGGARFDADQGGRAAVVFAGDSGEDLAASLAVVARAALASGSAWLYAWYGDSVEDAPANHDLLVLGPQSALDPRLMAAAPAEVRAAASAAANRAPRERQRFGSTAYASDTGARDALITGVAALFREPGGRRVALITAPKGADYARSAKRLARSGLWTGLEGQAALWGDAEVIAFGPSAAPRFSGEWMSALIRRNDEWFALGAFSLAVLLLLLGHGVKRTSSRRA